MHVAPGQEQGQQSGHIDEQKSMLRRSVDAKRPQLEEMARRIHDNPELGYHEYKAQQWFVETLGDAGFAIEKGVGGVETAFRATWGSAAGPAIGLLAEYDAFPNLGHACGHNLVGTCVLGAALALKDACPDLPGRVEVYGCPAEEVYSGKAVMTEAGVFDGLQAALACHPLRRTMTYRPSLAATQLVMKFHGKAAHAASKPWQGISALDPLIHTFVAVNALRQFFRDGSRIHGIITHGGDLPNMVPEYAEGVFLVRSATMNEVMAMRDRVVACAEAQAAAAGARFELVEGPTTAERVPNRVIADLYAKNFEQLGLEVKPATSEMGSSDVGNVGLVCPIVQAFIQIVPEAVGTHTREFAEAARSEAGMQMMVDGAKSLGMTVIDLCGRPDAMAAATAEWQAWKAEQQEERQAWLAQQQDRQ